MSKMKKMAAMYGMFAAMMGDYNPTLETEPLTEEEKERLKAIKEAKRIEKLKEKGLQEFTYGDHIIYARNKKNADRKARNKGYIK